MSADLVAPALALVLWSFVMLLWTMMLRIPALAKLKLTTEQSRGGRGSDLDRLLPREVNWPAHNYAHLMEQPTIFYATVLGIAIIGGATPLHVGLAWTYVGLRVVHSIWQATVNTIPVRAGLFVIYSLVLFVLAASGFMTVLRA